MNKKVIYPRASSNSFHKKMISKVLKQVLGFLKFDYRIKIVISVFFLGHASSTAQELSAVETLKKVETYYKNVAILDIEMEYKMFRGVTGNNITESYKGTMYKYGDISKVDILGSEIVQLPEAKIIVNNDNKTVMYSKAKSGTITGSPVDMSSFLKFYKGTSTRLQGNTIILEMTQTNVHIPLPYNKIILYIDKTTYQIKRQELYLSTKVPFVDENGKGVPDSARMEISFKPNPKPVNKVPQLKDYVLIGSNNTIKLSNNYANYTILDQTAL